MKLYSTDGSEMMAVTKIEPDGHRLLVSGTMMGAMPIEVVLTGTEMRKLFRLFSLRIILAALRMLLSK